MLAEVYRCDRKSCKSDTEATGRGDFFYADPNWMGIMVSTGVSEKPRERKDFCSFECLGMWIDEQIEKRRSGK